MAPKSLFIFVGCGILLRPSMERRGALSSPSPRFIGAEKSDFGSITAAGSFSGIELEEGFMGVARVKPIANFEEPTDFSLVQGGNPLEEMGSLSQREAVGDGPRGLQRERERVGLLHA